MDDNEKEKFFGSNEKEEEEESGFSESEAINENRSCLLQLRVSGAIFSMT